MTWCAHQCSALGMLCQHGRRSLPSQLSAVFGISVAFLLFRFDGGGGGDPPSSGCGQAFERDQVMLIMELADGGSLFDLVSRGTKVPEDEAAIYFKQMVSAVRSTSASIALQFRRTLLCTHTSSSAWGQQDFPRWTHPAGVCLALAGGLLPSNENIPPRPQARKRRSWQTRRHGHGVLAHACMRDAR
eukprot:SAG31_NODE_13456_length_867_cov_27.854167_3_plen_187_part_00